MTDDERKHVEAAAAKLQEMWQYIVGSRRVADMMWIVQAELRAALEADKENT